MTENIDVAHFEKVSHRLAEEQIWWEFDEIRHLEESYIREVWLDKSVP